MEKRKMKHILILCMILFAVCLTAGEKDFVPVTVSAASAGWQVKGAESGFTVTLTLPEKIYAYAEVTGVKVSGGMDEIKKPDAVERMDPLMDEKVSVYAGPGKYVWEYRCQPSADAFPITITAYWQACSTDGTCFMPETKILAVIPSAGDLAAGKFSLPETEKEPPAGDGPEGSLWEPAPEILMLPHYRIVNTAVGYRNADEFADFLKSDGPDDEALPAFAGKSVWMILILVLLGGLALNLTPCVLPLVPVNLAMLASGGENMEFSRNKRIMRGVVYGAGIALAYGMLGVIVVLTGSQVGMLASSWVFNAVAAVIFLVLALSMFGLFQIDLSRFGAGIRLPSSMKLIGLFLMGAFSAVLAGACVAPVLAAVLLEAASLYTAGNWSGLLLPFLLGLGMALPWPLAAAGMSLFPRPGAWMNYVKYALGGLILILGGYYAWLSAGILMTEQAHRTAVEAQGIAQVANALETAEKSGKRVLLDFGAPWCKNCTAMEDWVFPEPAVQKELQNMIIVRINVDLPENKELTERFAVPGVPCYAIIVPDGPDKK